MNALLCKPCITTDAELDICSAPGAQEDFATVTMQAIRPENTVSDEEELHVSFEEAISGRIVALGLNRNYVGPILAITGPLQNTEFKHALSSLKPLEVESHKNGQKILVNKNWLRTINYVCMAFMFMLIGFDLMGLLILHMH